MGCMPPPAGVLVNAYALDAVIGVRVQTRFRGYWSKCETDADWSDDFQESTGVFQFIPGNLRLNIDRAAYACDARLIGYVTFVEIIFENVWVFSIGG